MNPAVAVSIRRVLRGLAVLGSLALVSFSASHPAAAQTASDAEMARSALEGTFRTSNELTLDQMRQYADQRLATRLADARATDTHFLGIVVFSTSVGRVELARLADEYGFEVTAVEAKLAVGENGRVISMATGGSNLLTLRFLALSERLLFATGNQRYALLQQAFITDVAAEREELLAALSRNPDPLYYKATIIADIPTFARLRESSTVAAVLPDETEVGALAHRNMAQQMGRIVGPPVLVIGRMDENSPGPMSGGPPAPVSPTPEFDRYAAGRRAGATPLSLEAQLRPPALYESFLLRWSWEFAEYRAGRLEREQLVTEVWGQLIRGEGPFPTPGLADVWERTKQEHDADFVEFMDGEVIP